MPEKNRFPAVLQPVAWPADVAGSLTATFGDKQGIDDQHIKSGAPLFVPHCVTGDITHTLKAEGFDASEDGTGRGTPLVPVAYAIQAGALRTNPDSGPDGVGVQADHAYTLEARSEVQCVAFHGAQDPDVSGDVTHPLGRNYGQEVCIAFNPVQDGMAPSGDVTPPIGASAGGGNQGCIAFGSHANAGGQVAVAAYGFQPRIARNGRGDMGDVVSALNAQSDETGKGDAAPCVAVAIHENQRAEITLNDTAGAIKCAGGKPGQGYPAAMVAMQVRRLTPRECERLQGFHDDYTLIPWRGKPATECPDGPRYKALGNSMATTVMRWIGRRIEAALA